MAHAPIYTNAKFYIKDVTLDLGVDVDLVKIIGLNPGTSLGMYFQQNVSGVFLPSITFDTKEICNSEVPERIPVGLRYSDLVIDLDAIHFKPSLIEYLQPVDFVISLFQMGESSLNPLVGQDQEILFKIYGCKLKDHIVGDFNHSENKIKRMRLIYQPSYVKIEPPQISII